MVDIHSHIIYSVDDGSRGIEESIEIIKEAQCNGFTDIIVTPHYMEGYYECNKKEIEDKIHNINCELKKLNINVNLYQGNEIYITSNIINLIYEEEATTLAKSQYVLFELPMNDNPFNLIEVIYKILSDNKIPIIAHPERYSYIQQNPNMLINLIENGVLFQANYGSIMGTYGKVVQKTVKKLIQNNMIHFLGSDNHRTNTIYKNISAALLELKNMISIEEMYNLTTKNPSYILQNKKIDIKKTTEIKERKFFGII